MVRPQTTSPRPSNLVELTFASFKVNYCASTMMTLMSVTFSFDSCLDEGPVISPTNWVVWTSELTTSWSFGQLLD
jgi:hypothetical protein